MKFSSQLTFSLAALLAVSGSDAFSVTPSKHKAFNARPVMTITSRPAPLYAAMPDTETGPEVDYDIQRLKSMAAKLRAEAAELEARQAQERAELMEQAFSKLDRNNDGEIDVDELRAALEKTFKIDVSEEQAGKLMDSFDVSGDGKLQKDEFKGLEQMRNKLDAMVREEKEKARLAGKTAQEEAEFAKSMEAQLELINDKPPSTTDKIVSILPYLFPLMDGVVFGRFLLEGSDNPLVSALAVAYTIYRSIPLSGFLAFFGLNVLSGNLSINRLVRFNMQQAIFLDIALFIPGLITALTAAAASGLDLQIPAGLGEFSSDAVFFALLATIGYSTVSSVLGETPDKVPFISNAVNNRLPSVDDLLDSDGKFDVKKLKEKQDEMNKKDDRKD